MSRKLVLSCAKLTLALLGLALVVLARQVDYDLRAVVASYKLLKQYGYSRDALAAGAVRGMLSSIGDSYAKLDLPQTSENADHSIPSKVVCRPFSLGLYVAVPHIVPATVTDVQKAVSDLRDGDVLVIDLQGNPGGDLAAAIRIAQSLCPSDTPIIRVITLTGDERVYRGTGEVKAQGLCVLIDDTTGSAAELLAAALKYGAHARIIGKASHGKNSIQARLVLPNGWMLDVTSGAFTYPDGSSIGRIRPDVAVPYRVTVDSLDEIIKTALPRT